MSEQVALITGGSRGIGKACAKELAKAGFDVAVIYAGNEAAANETVSELKAMNVEAEAYKCDVSDAESVTYSYYQKNIKTAPKVEEKKKGFICTVCGYIYEGDTLPEDFVCPWCKHPASDFKPL